MTELIGAHIYNNNCTGTVRLFEIVDAFASFAGVRETSFCGGPYQEHVGEIRDGVTRTWLGNPKAWALYSGAPAQFQPPATGSRRMPQGRHQPNETVGQRSSDQSANDSFYDCRGIRMSPRGRHLRAGVYLSVGSQGVCRVPVIIR